MPPLQALSGAVLEAHWDRVGHITLSDRRRRPVGREEKKEPPRLSIGTRTIQSPTQFWISDAKLDHRKRRFQLICPSFFCFFSLLRRCYKNTTAEGEKTYQQKAQRKVHLLLSRALVCSKKRRRSGWRELRPSCWRQVPVILQIRPIDRGRNHTPLIWLGDRSPGNSVVPEGHLGRSPRPL